MKKAASVFALALLLGIVMSSCRARKVDCPAYGQNQIPKEAKHS
ncbi:MAG: hypothetical protein R2850_12895 [Bacteroidia bacterium]